MAFNKDLVFAIVIFIMAVILISQSAIVVQTYRKEGKAKDSNYWWSVFVLVVSILGLFAAGFMGYKSQKPGGTNGNGNAKPSNAASAAAGSASLQAAPMVVVPFPGMGAQPTGR